MERELRFNIAYKWFCGFTAFEATPDHSYFGRFRERVGTHRIGKILKAIVNKAKEKHLIRGVFYFVDATSIVTKNTPWAERDKALKKGEEALNNENVKKYSADPQARFGCKGKSKFWFGYKGHIGAHMGSGLIESAALTQANISDHAGFTSICPRDGQMVLGDKSYCLKPAQISMKARGAISAAILKHTMIGKNKDLDRWRKDENEKGNYCSSCSTKEQKDEGFSLDAQERQAKEYSKRNNIEINKIYRVDETASKSVYRKAYQNIIKEYKVSQSVHILIFDKFDRSSRNMADWVSLVRLIKTDERKEVHFVRDNRILHANLTPSDKLFFNILAVLSENYIDNLKQEVKKGLNERVLNGLPPI